MRDSHPEQEIRELTERIVQLKAELAVALQRVAALTTIDDTTGLHTWRAFVERAHTEIARAARYQREIGLVVFASDANDMRALADICRSQHRECDIAGLTEAREIVLLLPETSLHGTFVIGQRIWARAAKGRDAPPKMGCAAWPQQGRTLPALLSTARRALTVA